MADETAEKSAPDEQSVPRPWRYGELEQSHLPVIYELLSAPMDVPESRIQRTFAKATNYNGVSYVGTKKGYDTVGYDYQDILTRIISVVGLGHVEFQDVDVDTLYRENEYMKWEASLKIRMSFGNWTDGIFKPVASFSQYGGHAGKTRGDALKGAYTNCLKKVAAFSGAGQEAYLGTIDDDNESSGEENGSPPTTTTPEAKKDDTGQPPPPDAKFSAMDLPHLQKELIRIYTDHSINPAHVDAFCKEHNNGKPSADLGQESMAKFVSWLTDRASTDLGKLKTQLHDSYKLQKGNPPK